MAKKNQCYLCGGKLTDGYCPDCGLDNTRIHKKHYHLNESYSVESINGDTRKASVKCRERKGQASENTGMRPLQPAENSQNTGGQSYRPAENSQNTGGQSYRPAENSQNTGGQPYRPVQSPQNSGMRPSRPVQAWSAAGQPPQPVQTLRNGRKSQASSVPLSGKVIIAVSVIGLVAVLAGAIIAYTSHNILDNNGAYQYEPFDDYDYEEEYNDPYEYLDKELAETGEYYETELGQGEYLVGVHLPEGGYTAKLLEGSGSFSVDDFENGIYLWQAFGTDEEYDEVEALEDIRLFTGAQVSVDDGVVLQLETENGQMGQLEAVENPLTETVALKKDAVMVAGEDFPAGVYDLSSAADGWAVLRCKIPDEDYEEGYYERSYWLSGDELDDIFRNIYLREGVEITAEESNLILTPSEMVGSGDYEEYYKYY